MNIFFLSKDPKKCAQYHCDKHLVKMILETVQLLYTGCWFVWYETENKIQIADRTRKAEYKLASVVSQEAKWIKDAPPTKNGSSGYRPTHYNHPCAVWVRESLANYHWLCQLGKELCQEYTYRYGKVHSCQVHLEWLSQHPPPIPVDGELTEVRLAMPDKYKVKGDPIRSYRNYYRGDKAYFAQWTRREVPLWYQLEEDQKIEFKQIKRETIIFKQRSSTNKGQGPP